MADQGTAPPTDGVEEIVLIISECCGQYAKSRDVDSAFQAVEEAARRIAALPHKLTAEDVRRVVQAEALMPFNQHFDGAKEWHAAIAAMLESTNA